MSCTPNHLLIELGVSRRKLGHFIMEGRDNMKLRLTEAERLRAVNAKLLSALEKAEYLFGSVRIEIVAEDYDKANDAAAKGESLCCEAVEEARK